MCRHNCRVKSSPEEVVSADENLLIYCKPVRLYNILHLRNLCNRAFLPRCLDYKIRARSERKSRFTGMVVFNYKDRNNTLQKTEVTENCSCPFCYMRCGSFKGLQLHLTTIHDLFEFEFVLSEEYQTVNVSVKLDESGFEVEIPLEDKHEPYFFCSKSRKHRKRGDRKKARRLNVRILPMDSPNLANGTENGIDLNDGNHGLGYPEAIELVGKFGMTNNTPPAITDSSVDSDAKSLLPSEAVVVAATKARKLSAERSEARSNLNLQRRQFYHSHRVQPMSLEQVMSDRDSEDEVDDDVADLEDRQMLDDFVDVSKDEKHFMHLWNSFVRKQRVIADGHISWACEAFSRFYKKQLLNCSPLLWCWRLFMIKLWNHGLVDSSTINNCNAILESCDNNNSDTNNNNSVEDHHDDMEVDNNS